MKCYNVWIVIFNVWMAHPFLSIKLVALQKTNYTVKTTNYVSC